MKKSLFVIFGIFFVIIFLIGCFDQGVTTNNNSNKITLESEVVEFYNCSLKYIKEEGEIISAQVEYLFRNIAPREIKITVTAEFYDKDNNLLGLGQTREIELLKGYTETSILPANRISYEEEDAEKVDHVKLYAIEK